MIHDGKFSKDHGNSILNVLDHAMVLARIFRNWNTLWAYYSDRDGMDFSVFFICPKRYEFKRVARMWKHRYASHTLDWETGYDHEKHAFLWYVRPAASYNTSCNTPILMKTNKKRILSFSLIQFPVVEYSETTRDTTKVSLGLISNCRYINDDTLS